METSNLELVPRASRPFSPLNMESILGNLSRLVVTLSDERYVSRMFGKANCMPQYRSLKILWDDNYSWFSFQASLSLSLANNARTKERDRVCDEHVSRPLVQMPAGTCLHDWRMWTSHAAEHVSWMQGCDWWKRPPTDWRKHAGVWDEQRQNEVWAPPTELQINRVLALKELTRYLKLFLPRSKFPLNWRKSQNNSFLT